MTSNENSAGFYRAVRADSFVSQKTAQQLLSFFAQANNPYLALNASLAAAAVAGVAVQAAVAAAFLPREADGSELRFLPRIYAGDARGSQESSAALCGQRLKKETVVHLHPIHIKILIWYVVQSQQVSLSTLHRAVPRQLWETVSVELGGLDSTRLTDQHANDWYVKNRLFCSYFVSFKGIMVDEVQKSLLKLQVLNS